MLNSINLSPIGIGTRWIWWFTTKDTTLNINQQIDALAYMFSQGCNFCEINIWYAEWYAAEIVAKALKESWILREDIFLCLAIYLKDHKTIDDAQNELECCMKLFETSFVDTVQFTMSNFLYGKFEYITEWIDEILDDKKTRYTSLTNWNLDFVKVYHNYYKDHFFSHEVVFNFEIRENETNGIIPFNKNHDIKTFVYQPLRRNRTALRKRDIKNYYHKNIEKLPIKYSWIGS
jgi:aryl-alcohol dehydrogenase-like predicted oxidoreductase